MWREELEGEYGGLARTHLEATTCAFKLFEGCERASELQRRAMSALGSLPASTVELVGDRERRTRKDGGRTKGQAPRRRLPVFEELERGEHGGWGLEDVRRQRVFFNPWHRAGTLLTGRSTLEVELAAVRWAEAGIVTYGDLLDAAGVRVGDEGTFSEAYPELGVGVLRAAMDEMLPEWRAAVHGGGPGPARGR